MRKPQPNVFAAGGAEPRVFIDSRAPAGEASTMPATAAVKDPVLDASRILTSIGEVPYHWRIDTDRLLWGANSADVLKIDGAMIDSGRAYATLVGSTDAKTRTGAVMQSEHHDQGAGVPYTVQHCLRSDTAVLWVEDSGRWFAGPDGRPAFAHGVVRVINDRHRQEERLDYLSRFDALTGEFNRWSLLQVLTETLDQAIRLRTSCGFLLIAIDGLDHLNESYSFSVADEVIAAVGKRIHANLRGGDCIGRISGNRFGVVLKNCGPDDLKMAADRLGTGVRDDMVHTTAGPVAVTVTIGGVVAPRHARTVDEVLVRAREAMSRAKARRHGSFQAYQPSIEREARRRENMRASDEIVAALNDRRVALVFEPVARTGTRETAFYECLMRLQRPDGSLLPAQNVVPVAERLGLVRLLDHRVLELVVSELAAAPAMHASLNVSPPSTTDPDWWNGLVAHLRLHAGVAERLIIEITETAAIHDINETRGFVRRVKDLGCHIAIDDFGAGYTSFRNLRHLSVDLVKIDGAFVQNVLRSGDDRVFVQTLIDLARRLGLETVAEWVQDEQAAAVLTAWGCDYLQGTIIGLASPERPWISAANPTKGRA